MGGDAAAMLRLEDLADNGNRSSAEALYVHDLIVGPGSTLDLGGLAVYYDGQFVNEGSIIGGAPMSVPEPSTIFPLMVGLLALARRGQVGRR